MSFRVAIGQYLHETNSFSPGLTQLDAFKALEYLRGPAMVTELTGTRTYIGGMLDAAREIQASVVPLIAAYATPSGHIAAQAHASIQEDMLAALREAMPVDAVCLALHGAGVAENSFDIEGDLIKAVRELVGPAIPIAVTLDLHGNITRTMAEQATGLFGVNFYPHTDMYERGLEAMHFLAGVIGGQVRPNIALEIVDLVIPSTNTEHPVIKELNELCWELEKQPGIVDCTLFHGFARSDTPHTGMSVVVVGDGDPAVAAEAAQKVKQRLLALREQLRPDLKAPEQALREALALEGGPIVVNDMSDNPGGGGAGDSTGLLGPMLAMAAEIAQRAAAEGLQSGTFGFIYDPEVARLAHEAGVGATIHCKLGAKTDDRHGLPLEVTAYVKALTDGQFVQTSAVGRGKRVNLGKMARLVIDGIDVLVSSVRTQTLDDEVFRLHGIDVTRYKLVALKSANHFRAGFDPLAKAIVTADGPGLSARDVRLWPYQNLRRPLWPFDEIEEEKEVEKEYSARAAAAKLRRLAAALEAGESFEIQVAGNRISVPAGATIAFEYERDGEEEELEIELKWSRKRPV